MIEIRQTEMMQFMKCRRQWFYRYYMEPPPYVASDKPGKAALGTAIHGGLAAYYNESSVENGVYLAIEGMDPPRATEDTYALTSDWFDMQQKATMLVDRYAEHVAANGLDVQHETLAVEHEWRVELAGPNPTPITLYGAIDRVYRSPLYDGVVIQDHKSSDKITHLVVNDFQTLTYCWAWRELTGETPRAGQHNHIRTVDPTNSRSKPPFYDRSDINVNDTVLDIHGRHLRAIVDGIVATRYDLDGDIDHHKVAYPTPTRDCSWQCPFTAECQAADTGGDWEAIYALR